MYLLRITSSIDFDEAKNASIFHKLPIPKYVHFVSTFVEGKTKTNRICSFFASPE